MQDKAEVKSQILGAFAHVEYPGDWCLRGSNEGDEPYRVEEDFVGKTDWRTLDADFIDQSPGGLASALSFFSGEAFHFYLPAYLIADIDGKLQHHNPVFHLTHGLTDQSKNNRVNPRRYGDRTWFQSASHKFSMFNKRESAAIAAYLQLKRDNDEYDREEIDQALQNFWRERST